MKVRRIITKLATKEMKRKTVVVILVLLSISSYHVLAFFSSQIIFPFLEEYSDGKKWPTEIQIYPSTKLTNYSYFEYVAQHVNQVEGVKWIVYPGGGISLNLMPNYSNPYYLQIMWCNVEDITFPNQKYLIKGDFFNSNNESSIIIENIAERYFEKYHMFNSTENRTTLQILGFNFSVIGVIASPRTIGVEDYYLELGNVLFAWVPLHTYYLLIDKVRNITSERSFATFYHTIHVKIREGYDPKDVANRIRNTFKDIRVSTFSDFKAYIRRIYIQMLLVFGLTPLILTSLVILWDVSHNIDKIILLKVLGWRRKDILYYLIGKYGLLGAIAGVIGMIWSISAIPLLIIRNMYIFTLFFSYFPIQILLMTLFTIGASIPAIYRAFNASAESLLRA